MRQQLEPVLAAGEGAVAGTRVAFRDSAIRLCEGVPQWGVRRTSLGRADHAR
jgi:hypothetical protein